MGVFKRNIKSKEGKTSQYWYIRYTVNGKEKWESVGKVGIVTKTFAQKVLDEKKRLARLEQYDQLGAKIPYFIDFSNEYIKHQRDVKKKRSWKRDQLAIKYLRSFFGNRKLSEIKPKDVDDYKNLRLNQVSPASVNRELEVLRHLFFLAERWNQFFGRNPVSIAGLLTLNNQVERILAPGEQDNLIQSSPPYLRAIIVCALNTGMRKNEILTLKWDNIDLDTNTIVIEQQNTKTKRSRKIPINTTLRKLFVSQKLKSAGNEYVFLNSRNKPYSRQDSLNNAFRLATKKAKIVGLRFHDLRHTAATRMLEAGANIVAVSRILGHSDIRTTMRYAHPDDSLINAVEKLENFDSDRSKNRSNENLENLELT